MAALPAKPQPTVDAIYAAYEARRRDHKRDHLGASIIGNECERALWYTWRWASEPVLNGRKLRLFETGDIEEDRLIRNLRDAGLTVIDRDPESGRQWSVRDETGHFGGGLDGTALGVHEAPKTWHVLETKTHNTKSFADLKAKGVQASKPAHYAQMTVYMKLKGLDRALYVAVHKDTDEIYIERVRLDEAYALRILAKAQRIIDAPAPLPKISQDPSYYLCRWCDHSAVCHDGGWAPRHCRSCAFATPVTDGQWHCDKQDKLLPLAEQKAGCLMHRYIPALVPGEQVDWREREDGAHEIVYRMADGEWTDGEGMP